MTRVWLWAIVSATLAAGVLTAAVRLPGGEPDAAPRPTPSPSEPVVMPPSPAYFIGVGGRSYRYQAVNLDQPVWGPSDGAPRPGGIVTAVTAVGDGNTFYAARWNGTCQTHVTRITVDPRSETRLPLPVSGKITAMAASETGRRLAYALERCDGRVELRVRNLRVNVEDALPDTNAGATRAITSLSWSPDGESIAYATGQSGFRIVKFNGAFFGADGQFVDTFLGPPLLGRSVPGSISSGRCYLTAPVYRGGMPQFRAWVVGGGLTAVMLCARERSTSIVVVEEETGQPVGVLFSMPGRVIPRVEFDKSGTYALVEGGDGTLRWWWPRGEVREVPGTGPALTGVAW